MKIDDMAKVIGKEYIELCKNIDKSEYNYNINNHIKCKEKGSSKSMIKAHKRERELLNKGELQWLTN